MFSSAVHGGIDAGGARNVTSPHLLVCKQKRTDFERRPFCQLIDLRTLVKGAHALAHRGWTKAVQYTLLFRNATEFVYKSAARARSSLQKTTKARAVIASARNQLADNAMKGTYKSARSNTLTAD